MSEPLYFFDTTVLVAYFKDEDSYTIQVVEPVLRGETTAAISVVSVAEVFASSDMRNPVPRDRRRAVLEALQVIPIDRRLAERAGELRREQRLELPDALIAACAEHAGAQFLSKDPHLRRLLQAQVLAGEVYE